MLLGTVSAHTLKAKFNLSLPYILMVLLFSPSEKIQFFSVFIASFFILLGKCRVNFINSKKLFKRSSLARLLAALLCFQLINYLFAYLRGGTDLLAFPLFIFSFWLPMFFAFLVTDDNYKYIARLLRFIILLEIALVFLMQIKRGSILPNDFARGSTTSTHLFAFCIIWLLYEYIFVKKFNFLTLVITIISSFVLFLGDAKSMLLVASILLIFLTFLMFKKKYPFIYYLRNAGYFILLALILFVGLSIKKIYAQNQGNKSSVNAQSDISLGRTFSVASRFVGKKYGSSKLLDLYVNGGMNHKTIFIKRGFEYLLKNNLILVGTSPGTLGSRASNARAIDTLFKPVDTNLGFLGTYSSPATKLVYNNLYTEEYHKRAKAFIKILALPFSSVFSFIFENGILGFTILLLSLIYLLRIFFRFSHPLALESIFLILLVFFYGFLNTVWERPFLMGVFYVILGINYRRLKNESSASDKYVPQ